MKRLEMIGLSGVGKTTLYNKIINIPVENRDYLTLKEAYKLSAMNQDISFKQLKLWLYQVILKYNLYDSKAWGIGKTILHSLKKRQVKFANFEPFIISHFIYLQFLKENDNHDVAYKRVAKFIEKIEEYLILEDSFPKDVPVVIDEGINHCHPGVTEYGVKNYSAEELKNDITLNPTGLISCEQSADVIFQQAMKRKKNGIKTFTHGSMNRDELKDHIDTSIKHYEKKVSYYKEIGIPILHIDTRDNVEKNSKKINDFARSFISN